MYKIKTTYLGMVAHALKPRVCKIGKMILSYLGSSRPALGYIDLFLQKAQTKYSFMFIFLLMINHWL